MPRFLNFSVAPARRAKVADEQGESRAGRPVPVLSEEEERFLSGITTSEQFTLDQTLSMYAGVRSLRDAK